MTLEKETGCYLLLIIQHSLDAVTKVIVFLKSHQSIVFYVCNFHGATGNFHLSLPLSVSLPQSLSSLFSASSTNVVQGILSGGLAGDAARGDANQAN